MQASPSCQLSLGEKAVDAEPSEVLGERHHFTCRGTLALCYQKTTIPLWKNISKRIICYHQASRDGRAPSRRVLRTARGGMDRHADRAASSARPAAPPGDLPVQEHIDGAATQRTARCPWSGGSPSNRTGHVRPGEGRSCRTLRYREPALPR